MLKRQRSSPSFSQDAYASPEPPIDVYERIVKRRRQAAPPNVHNMDKGKAVWRRGDSEGESDVDDAEECVERAQSEQAQRLEQAGEYKNVNTLLHDLHAEQRHRMLFSSSPLPSHTPDFHHVSSHADPQVHQSLPSSSTRTVPARVETIPYQESHKLMPSFTISLPSEKEDMIDYAEVQRVTQAYEETNRYVSYSTLVSIEFHVHSVPGF